MVLLPRCRTLSALALLGACVLPAPSLRAEESPDPTVGLVKALQDDNPLVRKRAAVALGRLGPPARTAAGALEKAQKDADADVRAAASAALEKLDAPHALADLLRRVAEQGTDGRRRAEACRELAERFGTEPAAVRALEAALDDPVIKLDAARSLEMIDTRAKQKATAAARPGTRLAVLNLKQVVMSYKKWQHFTDGLKADYKAYETRVNELTARTEKVKKEATAATDPDEKSRLEKQARKLQQEIQEIADDAKKDLGKREADELVLVYREVNEVVAAYARENDIDLVMHYNDATTEAEMNSPANIQRKMVTGPTVPLYMKSGDLDISAIILERLNDRYASSGAHPAGK